MYSTVHRRHEARVLQAQPLPEPCDGVHLRPALLVTPRQEQCVHQALAGRLLVGSVGYEEVGLGVYYIY